jgi:uncharacterized damage-inducible protein DinB
MITPGHVQLMARYNRWQNQNLYGVADGLTDAQRMEDCGAHFGSVHKTLTHLMWADQNWMGRFTGRPAPYFDYGAQRWPKIPRESVNLVIGWDELKRQRAAFDRVIIDWAATVDPSWLGEVLSWTHSSGRQISKPYWMLVTHMFNHQTHHRGQVHCLLTGLGGKPDDTDIPWLPMTD